jgi:hypothetical protein
MIASRKALIIVAAFVLIALGLPWGGVVPTASAQTLAVSSADPNTGEQGTLNLSVIIKGKGFKNGAKAKFYKTGTTDPAGVNVKSTQYVSSTQLVATIDIADTAALAAFDIQVMNTDGRTGKGTELFSVLAKKIDPCAVPDPVATFLPQGGPWPAETVSAANSADFGEISLAFHPFTGQPAITYSHAYGCGVRFVAREGTTWGRPVVIDPNAQGGPELAFNPQTGYPTIAYVGAGLDVAQWDGTRWVLTTVDPGETMGLSLGFDPFGRPSISYRLKFGKGLKAPWVLGYAWFDGTWHTETVDWAQVIDKTALDVAPWTALAFDSYGRPTIAYATGWYPTNSLSSPFCTLKVAKKGEAGWSVEQVNAEYGAGGYVSLAYDASGVPVIVDRAGLISSRQSLLRFFRRDGSTASPWSLHGIPIDSPAVAGYPQLKFEPATGDAFVMYQHGGNYNEVVIARLVSDGTFLGNEVVLAGTDGVDVYYETSLAFDNQGVPAIAFRYDLRSPSDPYLYLRFARPWWQ